MVRTGFEQAGICGFQLRRASRIQSADMCSSGLQRLRWPKSCGSEHSRLSEPLEREMFRNCFFCRDKKINRLILPRQTTSTG